ncbi:hypothetical protein C3486_11795 [Streptomyces sp. Ru73]|nr:hypothetical protein C3486_11795 [Streptomyces sp. Ru73]
MSITARKMTTGRRSTVANTRLKTAAAVFPSCTAPMPVTAKTTDRTTGGSAQGHGWGSGTGRADRPSWKAAYQ